MITTTFRRIVREAPFHDAGHGFDEFGLHPPTLAALVAAARPIYDSYFRVDSLGASKIPTSGPVILVANHGGVLPVDAAVLCLDVLVQTRPARIPRPVADHFVSRLPFVSTLFARAGMVSGTRANVSRLLARGELVALWPEGVSGPAKSFRDRYTLQKWSVGFAELAIRHRATIVPVAIVGAEESWPLLGKIRTFHRFGAPYLPVPATPVPLPVHYHIRYGTPMTIDAAPDAADDPAIVNATASEVQRAVEQLLADSRDARRGVFR